MRKKVKSASKSVPIQVFALASQKGSDSPQPPLAVPHAHGKTVFVALRSVTLHVAQKYVFVRKSNHNFMKTFVGKKQEIHGDGAQQKKGGTRPTRKQTYKKKDAKQRRTQRESTVKERKKKEREKNIARKTHTDEGEGGRRAKQSRHRNPTFHGAVVTFAELLPRVLSPTQSDHGEAFCEAAAAIRRPSL